MKSLLNGSSPLNVWVAGSWETSCPQHQTFHLAAGQVQSRHHHGHATTSGTSRGAWRYPGGDGCQLGFHLLVSFSATRWCWLDAVNNLHWHCRGRVCRQEGRVCRQGQAGEVWQISRQELAARGVASLPLRTLHIIPTSLPGAALFPFHLQTPIAPCSLKPSAGHTAWQSMHRLSRHHQHRLQACGLCLCRQKLHAPAKRLSCRAVTRCLSPARCVIKPRLQSGSPAEMNVSLQWV